MEEMKFKSLQRGDSVFTLERDRRSKIGRASCRERV